MLATGTRSKVLADNEDATAIGRVIKDEILNHGAIRTIAPITKEILAKAFLVGGLEETGRYNLVGIHVLYRQRNTSGCNDVEFLFHNNVRGSVITPVTAAAAATSGEQRRVRAPGP